MGRTTTKSNDANGLQDVRINGVGEDVGLNLKSLKSKKIGELTEIARNFNVEGASSLRKQDLIFSILQAQAEQSGFIYGEGVLEILSDGFGFLRSPDRMTFMYPRARFGGLVYGPETSWPGKSVRPKKASAILPC